MNWPFKKKTKTGYPKSFAKRLTWRIMLTLLIVMGITSTLIFSGGYLAVNAGSRLFCNRFVKGKATEVEALMSEIRVACINNATVIEENIGNPDKMYDLMERIVKQNPAINSCGLSFIDNYYPQKGSRFCPYAYQEDSVTIKQEDVGQKYNYLEQEWFKRGIEAEEGYWSTPFHQYGDTLKPLVSYMLPIRDKSGRTVAVLGADLSLLDLRAMTESTRRNFSDEREKQAAENGVDSLELQKLQEPDDLEYEPFYFITDTAGTYIVHPFSKKIINDNFIEEAKARPDTLALHLAHQMAAGKRNFVDEDEDGNDLELEDMEVIASFRPVAHTSWSICLVMPALFVDVLGYVFGGLMLLFIVIGLLVIFFVGRLSIKRSSKPLKRLAVSADEVAKGNFNTVLPPMKSRDEIHQLRDSFEQMQLSLKQYVADLREATAQKAAIENEMKVAHDIQMSMLPKTFPPYPERCDLDIFGSVTPAKGVGGDLFDFYIRDEQLFFCIGDVSGKGVPASLYMAVTRSLFRNISLHVSEPARIVNGLNQAQSEGNDTNMFVTLFVGVLDLKTGALRYCNAGHDAPLLMGRDVTLLPCECNLPIGVVADFIFEQQELTLEKDTTIFLYTDGLNEAENIEHAQFGDNRIMDIATSLVADKQLVPMQVIRHMTDAVHTFVGIAEQSDDLTMLAIQYK